MLAAASERRAFPFKKTRLNRSQRLALQPTRPTAGPRARDRRARYHPGGPVPPTTSLEVGGLTGSATRTPCAQAPTSPVCEAYVLADRLRGRSRIRRASLTLVRERGQPSGSLARSAPTTPKRADGPYREALALAEEPGMRPLVAHCHLGLGKLYAPTDKREQAHEHLTTATTMFRRMDKRF